MDSNGMTLDTNMLAMFLESVKLFLKQFLYLAVFVVNRLKMVFKLMCSKSFIILFNKKKNGLSLSRLLEVGIDFRGRKKKVRLG